MSHEFFYPNTNPQRSPYMALLVHGIDTHPDVCVSGKGLYLVDVFIPNASTYHTQEFTGQQLGLFLYTTLIHSLLTYNLTTESTWAQGYLATVSALDDPLVLEAFYGALQRDQYLGPKPLWPQVRHVKARRFYASPV